MTQPAAPPSLALAKRQGGALSGEPAASVDTKPVFSPPAVRTVITWDVSLIRAAESQARSGHLRLAAELIDDILGDDRAPGVLRTRVQALLGLDVGFEAGAGRKRRAAVKALEALEDWWSMFPEEETEELLTWGFLLGAGLGQMVPREGDNGDGALRYTSDGRLVPRLKVWHPRWLRWDALTREWKLTACWDGGITTSERVIHPGDGTWVLFTPYGRQAPWMRGLWRGWSRLWLFKLYAVNDWADHSEKGAQTVVETTESSTRQQRLELARDLSAMASEGVAVLAKGQTAKLLEVAANTAQIYGAQVELVNRSFGVSALGHNLSSEVADAGTGATAGETVRYDIRAADGKKWSTCTHDQVLVWWATWNFGDPDAAPWPAYPTAPVEDKQKRATWLGALSTALPGLEAQGVDVHAVLENDFGLPMMPVEPDAKAKKTIFAWMSDSGIFTINEIRAAQGYPPVPDGNVPPVRGASAAPAADPGAP